MRTGTVYISEEMSGTARGTARHLILLQNSAGSFLSFQSCLVMSEALTRFSQSQKYPRLQNTFSTVRLITWLSISFDSVMKVNPGYEKTASKSVKTPLDVINNQYWQKINCLKSP